MYAVFVFIAMGFVDTETPCGDTVNVGKSWKMKRRSVRCGAPRIRQQALEKPLGDHNHLVPLRIIRDYVVCMYFAGLSAQRQVSCCWLDREQG